MKPRPKRIAQWIVDFIASVLFLLLFSYQATGPKVHEWLGVCAALLIVAHLLLNLKWFASLFKGKYRAFRVALTAVGAALLVALVSTVVCGLSISDYAAPFCDGIVRPMTARRFHLACSYWTLFLAALHCGLNFRVLFPRRLSAPRLGLALSLLGVALAGSGLYLLLKSGASNYLLFKSHFAFLDYDKSKPLVLLENFLALFFWGFVGAQLARALTVGSGDGKRAWLAPVGYLALAVLVGAAIRTVG